jgi:hypothetical protein
VEFLNNRFRIRMLIRKGEIKRRRKNRGKKAKEAKQDNARI